MEDLYQDNITTVDRSTLERWSECPAQAKFLKSGQVTPGSLLADAGNVVHDAISKAVADYIDTCGAPEAWQIVEDVVAHVKNSRPDVQPNAIQAVKFSAWTVAKWLRSIHHDDIIRFDGGSGELSGQLAWDIDLDDAAMRVTSELDMLYATASDEVVEIVDWKSGFKTWTATDIKASFQFPLHAWLVMQNYPGISEVGVRVFNTRWNSWTGRVVFRRDDLDEYESRIAAAAKVMVKYRDSDDPPTWPSRDKCRICDAASLCPIVGRDIRSILESPAAFLADMNAVSERLKAMQDIAADHVQRTGEDIVAPDGLAFGIDKPKANRRPQATMYSVDGE